MLVQDQNVARMEISVYAQEARVAGARVTAVNRLEKMIAKARIGGFQLFGDETRLEQIVA